MRVREPLAPAKWEGLPMPSDGRRFRVVSHGCVRIDRSRYGLRSTALCLSLFSLSGALEHFALGRTQKEIRSLFREAPKFATVLDELPQGRDADVYTPSSSSNPKVPGMWAWFAGP